MLERVATRACLSCCRAGTCMEAFYDLGEQFERVRTSTVLFSYCPGVFPSVRRATRPRGRASVIVSRLGHWHELIRRYALLQTAVL
jgi:hypothetical protein